MEPERVRTTCAYCGVGCGLVARRAPDGRVTIQGDETHPGSRGRLCVKGATLGQTLSLEGRLLAPYVHGERVSWDAALSVVADGFARVAREHGPGAVAFYLSGQLLTEDYYVANKLGKGFLGTGNVDTNSRLCMASSVAAYKRAFGGDLVPTAYEDLDEADLVIWAGSNAAICHPVLFERALEARARRGTHIVTIDPRRTATAEASDLHLPVRPGTDANLWKGLLAYLDEVGAIDRAFVETYTDGIDATLARVADLTVPALVARVCGVPLPDLLRFYALFAERERIVTAHSQGVHQSTSGTDKVNAIVDCHLAKGCIGKPGCGPLSLTGQVNAMGGREVGGLATTLAAHMGFDDDDVDRVSRFWGTTSTARAPGLPAVQMFQAMERGEIRAVWIACTNPLASLPDADAARRALSKCELVVVSEVVHDTETARAAHVLLPALGWGEKDGSITSSERRIARQRAFLPPPGEARPDWWMFAEVGKRLGHEEAFDYEGPHDIFREHARLSAFENEGARLFDLGGFQEIDRDGYARLAPTQWPVRDGEGRGTTRLFADGHFGTADHKAHFVPSTPRPPAEALRAERPYSLTTGRLREHWHTMTRTERVPALAEAAPEPLLEIHPDDAAAHEIGDDDLVRITSDRGVMIARAALTVKQPRGTLFVPIHWRESVAPQGRAGALVGSFLDPLSHQPELKHAAVSLARVPAVWEGFMVCRTPVELPGSVHVSVRVRGRDAFRYELAGCEPIEDPAAWSRALLAGHAARELEWIELSDAWRGRYRAVCFREASLVGAVYIEPTGSRDLLPRRQWIMDRFDLEVLPPDDRVALLAGGPRPRSPKAKPARSPSLG